MAKTQNRIHKHFQLDTAKLKRAQKALRAKTETETVDLALDLVIAECKSNRLTLEANDIASSRVASRSGMSMAND